MAPVNEFTSEARKYSGSRTRWLDAYAYGTFNLGDERKLDLRLGNQVVAWGESLFMSGISAVQGPVDATKANVPGTEVKDILLPELQAAASLALNRNWSLLGYYQFRHHPYELSPVGDYFSTSGHRRARRNFLRLAPGDPATAAKIVRGPDIRARTAASGVSAPATCLTANTQVGLYYLRYHDRIPSVVFNANGTYKVKYFEDIKLTGRKHLDAPGRLAGLRRTQPQAGCADVLTSAGAQRGKATQIQLSGIQTWGQTWIAPQAAFFGESRVPARQQSQRGLTRLVQRQELLRVPVRRHALTYPNVFSGWDMDIPLSYGRQYNNASVSFSPFTGNGDHRASIGARFKYLGNTEIGLTYNAFLGSPNARSRTLADRDFIALSAKYSF